MLSKYSVDRKGQEFSGQFVELDNFQYLYSVTERAVYVSWICCFSFNCTFQLGPIFMPKMTKELYGFVSNSRNVRLSRLLKGTQCSNS